ncbi:MAG: hypothetical protein H7Z43_15460, partial [Clostridia bacterium]|nr:hypothetical protein [Deltaproteobacteria bacterium]
VELVSKLGYPDKLALADRKLFLRRERGAAIFDLTTMKSIWSFPILGGHAFEWSRFDRDHYAWLGGTAVPQQTTSLLATTRRAALDALFARTIINNDTQHIVSDDARLASDAFHAHIAARSQAYLDDRSSTALFAGTNLRITQADYFNDDAGFSIAPVIHSDNRVGVVVIDSKGKRAGAVWAGARIEDDPPLAIVDRKHSRVITVAPSFNPQLQQAYAVRGSVRHSVSVSAYALTTIDIKDPDDAGKVSAELVGVDPREIEGPRLIVAHDGVKLASRYVDHGCLGDYASQSLAAGTLLHYVVMADEQEMLGGLVRDGVKTDAPSQADYTPEELGQLVGSSELNTIFRKPDGTVNDALRSAAASGSTNEVIRLLGMDANPNSGLNVPGCDFGPLHFAIVKKDARMADALLKAGAWVNFLTPEGTALDLANGYKASKTLVNSLKSRGARRGAALSKGGKDDK